MIGLIGYNFCSDSNALDPTPTDVNNLTYARVQNGIFDHFNVSRDTSFNYDSIIPTDWDVNTVMDADFAGNIFAGNVAQMASSVTSIRVKRRIKGSFDWVTIREIPVSKPEDLSFVITDNLNAYNVEYEYAFVPMMEDVEGSYIIESILSKFEGVFICDIDTVFKFYGGVEYNGNDAVQQVGVFQPYNRKYPVIVSNSIVQYQTGNIGGWVLPEDYEDTHVFDRVKSVKEKEVLLNFLMNKKPKIIKDMNGNNWLVYFTGNPSIVYDNNYGQGMLKVSATWTEVGDPNSKDDLYENGLILTKR